MKGPSRRLHCLMSSEFYISRSRLVRAAGAEAQAQREDSVSRSMAAHTRAQVFVRLDAR